MHVGLIDYGSGNIQSVSNALARVGAEVERIADGAALESSSARAIVLPGVGAIDYAMRRLKELEFVRPLERLVLQEKRPFLGICVGMQVLFEQCHEFEPVGGLGWLPGSVARLDRGQDGLRLPHVGWNTIQPTGSDPVLADFADEHFYFVHSCGLRECAAVASATSEYGGRFAAAVRHDNVTAVQFHPEKSSIAGERLLGAFLQGALRC